MGSRSEGPRALMEGDVRIALSPRSSYEHAASRGDSTALCGARVDRILNQAWSPSRATSCPRCVQKDRGAKRRTAKPRTKIRAELDRLFAAEVRASGPCAARDYPGHRCAGPLQCAHIVSRRYEATRWDRQNAMPLCAGAHRFFTLRSLEWEAFVVGRLSGDGYEQLKRKALSDRRPDHGELLARLRGEG